VAKNRTVLALFALSLLEGEAGALRRVPLFCSRTRGFSDGLPAGTPFHLAFFRPTIPCAATFFPDEPHLVFFLVGASLFLHLFSSFFFFPQVLQFSILQARLCCFVVLRAMYGCEGLTYP